MKETITIRRSDCEQMLKQLAESQESVKQLQEDISVLKYGRDCRTRSAALSVNVPVQYGEKIKSTVSYLSTCQYIPYKRLSILFNDLFSNPTSETSIDNILEEISDKSENAYNEIRNRTETGDAAGSGKTGCRVNGHKRRFHTCFYLFRINTLLNI
ncbi:MAG: hypothetical protein LBH60_09240 [Prevotellaceae bacterium]|nr:hypothetical protein [Prevotellaceae bacterium]